MEAPKLANAITRHGVRIAYEELGDGPTTLLFLHGWAGSARYWREPLGYMDLRQRRAISISYRGHGESEKVTQGYDLASFADDILAVADAVAAERFVLVGFSMSGRFAQYFAVKYPQRVAAMVLVAPCAACELPFPPELADTWCSASTYDELAQVLAPFTAVPIRTDLQQAFYADFVKIPRPARAGTIEMFSRGTFVEEVRQLNVPVLVLAGEHDPILGPEYQRSTTLAHIPHSRMVVLPCGHELPHEMPRETAGLLDAFLAGTNEHL